MDKIQILFVVLFLLNLLLLWAAILSARFLWYRFAGYLLLLLIPLLTVWFEQPRFELDYYWWKWAGLASILMGLALGYWAIRELKKARDEWYSILPTMLVKSGPYQYLRHPVYLSLIFIWIGWWWLWAAAYSFYFGMLMLGLLWLHGYCEEKWVLEKHYGQIYVEYRQKTGMFWVK